MSIQPIAWECGCGGIVPVENIVCSDCGKLRSHRDEHTGFFDSPDQTEPTYNPDPSGPCLICWEPLTPDDVRTTSLMPYTERTRSYFFRTHASCADADPEHLRQIESAIIDWEVADAW